MKRNDELKIMNLQDSWTKLYYYLAKNLVEMFGIEGEQALREGIRNFGVDRGTTLRKEHLKSGLQPNLKNLFTYGDLPGDPRFRRNKIELTPQTRFSETLVCPMASLWKEMGGMNLGRIYCEEFHHAKFSAYAPHTQVNLTKTLTQDGDEFCRFSVYLRPANLNEKERKYTFYDDKKCQNEELRYEVPDAESGFEKLCIKMFYYFAVAAQKKFGELSEKVLEKALRELFSDVFAMYHKTASETSDHFNAEYVNKNCPFDLGKRQSAIMVWESLSEKWPQKLYSRVMTEFIKEGSVIYE